MEVSDLIGILKQFEYYKLLGDKTFSQLSDDNLFWQYNPESNSIAIIVHHMHGNMMSRWTDFLSSDGEKDWRNRDNEFEKVITTREQLVQEWEAGWNCLFAAIDEISDENIDTIIYIRNIGHTVMEAIYRQLAHYAHHVGQIVYIGRMIQGADWTSLSIPKNQSAAYNAEKFAQDKHRGHFTDEFLK